MKVTIVTATTGRPELKQCIESVAKQTHQDIQHLIFVDGLGASLRLKSLTDAYAPSSIDFVDFIHLPYQVGNNRWNAHRMYGAAAYFAEGDFIIFLDDDNTLDPTHVKDCLKVTESGATWAYSLRKIVGRGGEFLCNDDCESLGKWPSVIHKEDYFVDVNCYFLPKMLAIQISPLWYRKFREPGQPEVDRVLCHGLRQIAPNYESTYKYTVNYLVASNSELSVKPDFFEYGNAEMIKRYNGVLPWHKK